DFCFGAAADDVQLSLELILGHPLVRANEHLLDVGLGGARLTPDRIHMQRRIAPAERRKTPLTRDFFHDSFAQQPLLELYRQEHHSYAVATWLRQYKSKLGGFALEKLV